MRKNLIASKTRKILISKLTQDVRYEKQLIPEVRPEISSERQNKTKRHDRTCECQLLILGGTEMKANHFHNNTISACETPPLVTSTCQLGLTQQIKYKEQLFPALTCFTSSILMINELTCASAMFKNNNYHWWILFHNFSIFMQFLVGASFLPLYSQQVSHQRWIWASHMRKKHAKRDPVLVLKPRADITRPRKNYLCPPKIILKRGKSGVRRWFFEHVLHTDNKKASRSIRQILPGLADPNMNLESLFSQILGISNDKMYYSTGQSFLWIIILAFHISKNQKNARSCRISKIAYHEKLETQ